MSDLSLLLRQSMMFTNKKFVRKQLGADSGKLRHDSPLRHADQIKIPVMLVHGDKDAQVEANHSKRMAAELKSAKKPHRFIMLEDAGHDLNRKSDRVTLLGELEKFLEEHMRATSTGS